MKRRTKDKIIDEIINALENKELSVNEIATKIKANWSTVNNGLNSLKRLDIVNETITTPKIRMFVLAKKKKN